MPDKPTRQRKTPRQRAQEALGIAERRVERLTGYRDHQKTILAGTEAELADAIRRRDYLAADPDLPNPEPPLGRP